MYPKNDKADLWIYQKYVEAYNLGSKEELERRRQFDGDWTPYRFCSSDWLLAAAVTRCRRTSYEVALFLTEEHCMFEPFAGAKAALSFLLADAFHKTGKMELRFRGPKRDQKPSLAVGYEPGIPPRIKQFAKSIGVTLGPGRLLSDAQGRSLYQRLAEFNPALEAACRRKGVDPVQAAFLVHRSIWTMLGLEWIVFQSIDPAAVLSGALQVELWLGFKRELLVLRAALAGERVLTLFENSGQIEGSPVKASWHADGTPTLTICPDTAVRLESLNGTPIDIAGEEAVQVRLCQRESVEYGCLLAADLEYLSHSDKCFLAVTKDIDWSPEDVQKRIGSHAGRIFRIIDTVDELDSEVLARLGRCATTRASVEERGD